MDVRELEYFYYSQNSLNTFSKCPLKFKMKYMEDMSWKNDAPMDVEYYKAMKVGLDFHLICERYFSRVPLGVENSNEELIKWTEALQSKMPLNRDYIYLPEYEVKMVKSHIKLQAKYDLIILKPRGQVGIWDWKTENRKLSKKEMEKRFQTIVYMYVLKEICKEIFGIKIDAENIKMIFWQPQYEGETIEISYSLEKHDENEKFISKVIDNINQYDYHKDFNKELYVKQCGFCEFNYFCNNKRVNFNFLDTEE
jgi:CRISPR/Cas system-associated exonuclease Cas4 (RecB family)